MKTMIVMIIANQDNREKRQQKIVVLKITVTEKGPTNSNNNHNKIF